MNKHQIVETAYKSFLNTFTSPTHFIIDKPEPWIVEMVKNRGDVTTTDTMDWDTGNFDTFRIQLKLASEQTEPVLLLEDDYFWLEPDSENILEQSIRELGFVSPYDHPNHYFEQGYNNPRQIKVAGGRHWQSVLSTTLTFGATPELIRSNWDKLNGHGTIDDEMWKSITNVDKLWSPIPSLATHMETDYLSPTFKWQDIL